MKNLKLNKLNKESLNKIKAGCGWENADGSQIAWSVEYVSGKGIVSSCGCACAWASQGGSSTEVNHSANAGNAWLSPQIRCLRP